MKTAVLFDLDGTLLDTLEDLRDAVNYALAKHGFPRRSMEEVRGFVGEGAALLIKRAVDFSGNWPEVLDTFRAYYGQHSRVKTRPYEGILGALAAVSEKYPVAVVSNKPHSAVKALCREFFGDVYALGEQEGTPRKPAPDMLFKAMAALGADRCVYVGDSEVDVLTAKNAGVPCVSVLWGFRDKEVLEKAGAEHFCGHSRELAARIETLII